MRIDFTKMHGLGNDFIVFDMPAGASLPTAEQWRKLSNRHTGIGFDQALILEPPRSNSAAMARDASPPSCAAGAARSPTTSPWIAPPVSSGLGCSAREPSP
jgi:hypothetical protein